MTLHTFQRFTAGTLLAVAVAALQACGGGGGADLDESAEINLSDNPGGVASYNGVTSSYLGTISGLGSIVVNGVRFETTSAKVMDSDDVYGTSEYLSPLAMGMTVALQGSADDSQYLGRADQIRLVGGVRGVVSGLVAGQSMTVAGQVVSLDASTLFADASGANISLQVGDFVNVYGQMRADNSFLATRVVQSSANQFNLDAAWRGQSSDAVVSASGVTLNLGTGPSSSFAVSCPVSSCSVEPAGASLSGAHAVRVLSLNESALNSGSVVASKIQVLDATQLLSWSGSSNVLTKIKGVATLDGSQWLVGGVPVELANPPWQSGRFYEVKGALTEGRLVVNRWELEGQESYRSLGNTSGASSYYRNELYGAVSGLQGTRMTVQGVAVELGQAYFERGSLATLSNGAYVEVKGVMDVSGVLQASQVEVKTSTVAGQGTRFEVYGTVSNWTGAGLTLTSGNTVYDAVLNSQSRIDTEHGLPGNGQFVEVKGYMSGDQFVVLKLEVKRSGSHDD